MNAGRKDWKDEFLRALVRTRGNVQVSAELAGVTSGGVYWRRRVDPEFREQWQKQATLIRKVRRVTPRVRLAVHTCCLPARVLRLVDERESTVPGERSRKMEEP